MAPSTIGRGLTELAQDEPSERVRRPGAGRKPAIVKDPTLVADLEALVEPTTRGDPESPLRWTCKSVRRLAETLQQQGHQVSRTLVGELLNATGYSLQGNRKTKEGDSHPDRDAQFAHINAQVAAALADQQPVISVDTKKKELVGDFRNNGREYRPQGCPEEVRVHDFLIKELGRAVPYGVYDLAANAGWVSVGIDHDTAAFAVNSIRQWWHSVGRAELFAERTQGWTDPDDAPEPPAHPVAEPGDLWVLGRHRLLCGDSTVATDVERVLGGVAPHLMVTDPPYGVYYRVHGSHP